MMRRMLTRKVIKQAGPAKKQEISSSTVHIVGTINFLIGLMTGHIIYKK